MDVREKLVELANDVLRYLPWGEIQKDTAERIADRMMDHGVTVQELDGCDFCRKFDFARARAEVNKYGAHISLASCNTKFTNDERFKFCPMCGRRLPQPPKGE